MAQATLHTHIRSRLLAVLISNVTPGVRRWGGMVPVDIEVPDIAKALGETLDATTKALWFLQKEQMVTFRERKGNHGNVISRIRIKESLLEAPLENLLDVAATEVVEHAENTEVAEAITENALVRSDVTPCVYRKVAREWCVEHDARWPRGDMFCEAEWKRRQPVEEPTPEVPVANTPAALDGDLPAILVPPSLDDYPAIAAVLREERERAAVRKASDLLAESGLDDLALQVMEAKSEPMSNLEIEVLNLADLFGWTKTDA